MKEIYAYLIKDERLPKGMGYDCKVDVYAAALVIAELCGTTLPITGNLREQLTAKNYSKQLIDTIMWCLEKDPIKRPHFKDIMASDQNI